MEEGDPRNIDRKGKGKMEYSNVVAKGESSKKKDSEGNQNIVHEGSFSSVQENETAPVALPESIDLNKEINVVETDDTDVSISPTVAEDVVAPPPQTSPNLTSRTAMGGHGTAAEYDVLEIGESSKKKDSDENQVVTHKGSSSSVQENETAPVALRDFVNVLPQPKVEEGTSSSPNWRSGPALGGHGTVAEYDAKGKREPSKNKDSEGNQIVTHTGSSSFVQENQTAPVALRDFVLPPPKVEEGTSSSPNWRSGPALGGHGTVAEYDAKGKRESSEIKDSEGNQIVTHTGSSSFVQENQTAPVALPVSGTNVTKVSISLPVTAAGVVLRPPQVEQRTPSSSHPGSTVSGQGRGSYRKPQPKPRARSKKHTNFPLPGHGTLAAHGVLPPLQVGEGSSSNPNQRSSSSQYINFSPGCTTPATSKSTSPPSLDPPTFKLIDFSKIEIPLSVLIQSDYNSQRRPIYGGGGCSRTGVFQPLTDFYNNALAREQANDRCIDLLSRVGASNSLENEDNDGDHDQDHNNEEDDGSLDLLSQVGREEDDGTLDLLSRVGRKPSQ
ncbi:hypothetical protein L1887_27309 [Cichorium endivia]|nr:hypothetical protein L1887_27309 [Cichorium endivia]